MPRKVTNTFAIGSTFSGAAADGVSRSLTVAGTRWHQGRLLVRFAELTDRNAAEAARGIVLEVPFDPDERPEDPEEFYDHQLVGLEVRRADRTSFGVVKSIMHGAAQDLLVVDAGPDRREVLVPFVSALVPVVDVAAGHLVVADVPGLLDEIDETLEIEGTEETA